MGGTKSRNNVATSILITPCQRGHTASGVDLNYPVLIFGQQERQPGKDDRTNSSDLRPLLTITITTSLFSSIKPSSSSPPSPTLTPSSSTTTIHSAPAINPNQNQPDPKQPPK